MSGFDPNDFEFPPPPADADAPAELDGGSLEQLLQQSVEQTKAAPVAARKDLAVPFADEAPCSGQVESAAPNGANDQHAGSAGQGKPAPTGYVQAELFSTGGAIELDPIQRKAVELVCTARPGIVTGGPGTGKTTCLKTALDRLDAERKLYGLAAPTGKAAKRMSEATGRPASTVHRLLEFRGVFQRHRHNPLELDVVIVDEASMLDVELGAALVDAIEPRRTRLVLVGDADQLPSVGPGRVLADLCESRAVPVVRLQTLHRSAAQSWIHVNAPRILAGKIPDLATRPDFRWIEVDDATDIVGMIRELVTEKLAMWGIGDAQVLIPQRTGPAGIVAANCALQDALNPRRDGEHALPRGDYELRPGDRVIQTKNNYELEVFNGEVGTVEDVSKSGCVVQFPERDPLTYSLEQSDALHLAYALTVHKSQGSEFPWVVVVCHSTHTHMLTRQLFYTAVTRARQGVVLVGNKKGLGAATSDREPPRRNTALIERMRGEI